MSLSVRRFSSSTRILYYVQCSWFSSVNEDNIFTASGISYLQGDTIPSGIRFFSETVRKIRRKSLGWFLFNYIINIVHQLTIVSRFSITISLGFNIELKQLNNMCNSLYKTTGLLHTHTRTHTIFSLPIKWSWTVWVNFSSEILYAIY